jgi:5-hydroxyisourate hydrolase
VSLSTHVLDSVTGRPAAGMSVALESSRPLSENDGPVWVQVGGGITDADGRIRDWGEEAAVGPGAHRLTFATGAWSRAQGRECFYPEVMIAFTVAADGSADGSADGDAKHYHVPLLLSPYAYSTYRGS